MRIENCKALTFRPGQVALVVPDTEPFGVRAAAKGLADDLEDALGVRPEVSQAPPASAACVVWVESDARLARKLGVKKELPAPETFLIRGVSHAGQRGLLVSAADERGAIYGLFHIARHHLGVDPCKLITGRRASRQKSVDLSTAAFTRQPWKIPLRGWHIEGVTALVDWRTNKIPHPYWTFWDWMCETLLRCGGNMAKPETNKPGSAEVAKAQQWGLLITQEHCCPMGVGTFEIGKDTPGFNGSYEDFPEVFERAWEEGISKYPRPENVIWTLAYRGNGDMPFWENTPPGRYTTDKERGALITRALAKQVELVKKHCGKHKPRFIHNLWMEGNRLYSQGHTKVPKEALIVWADNGYGTFRSMISAGCEPADVKTMLPDQPVTPGTQGVYFHVSMWDFNTPFVTQFVPPRRMQEELGRALNKNLNAYLLINVGRVRDAITSIAAISDVWTNPDAWRAPPGDSSTDGGNGFLRKWARQHYGPHAEKILDLYETLYDAPFKWGAWGGWSDYMIGDVGYVRRAGILINEALSGYRKREYESLPYKFWEGKPTKFEDQLDYLEAKARGPLARWAKAHKQAASLQKQLKGYAGDFFTVDILSQLAVHHHLSRYLLAVIAAVRAYEKFDLPAAIDHARQAVADIDKVEAALRTREFDKWENWNTPALLKHACLPVARFHAQTLIEVAERYGPRFPRPN